MEARIKVHYTLEELLSRRVNLTSLTPDLYIEAKQARLSDSKIMNLVGATQGEFYKYKYKHNLIGITIPGYENVSKAKPSIDITKVEFSESKKKSDTNELIVEGTPNESLIMNENDAELHVEIAALEKKLEEAHQQISFRDEKIKFLTESADNLYTNLNNANHTIRSLEAHLEAYHEKELDANTLLDIDNKVLNEKLNGMKDLVKRLAELI